MRIVLTIFIGIHGMIHLFGFFKAFGLAEFKAISQAISKATGSCWFLTFLLFTITAILLLIHSDHWWVYGLMAVVISQILIFIFWSDAKFGTLANVIILSATIIGYSSFNFKQNIKAERISLFENAKFEDQDIITEEDLVGLPPIIKKWLIQSGITDKQSIANVRLVQELLLKLKPEETNWSEGTAEQYFTIQPPAFNWTILTEINPILPVVGRDKFEDGKGEMIIKLLFLIPVAQAKDDEKVDQATLQRYLAEIVWFPSASLSPYIKWETIDDYSASATMTYNGTTGSGEFHFDKDGNFEKFTCERYRDSKASKTNQWTVLATKLEERNGITIPVECEVNWELEAGEWTWLTLKITEIQYDLKVIPLADKVRP